MTSEIRTNSFKSRAGLSTVTMTDSGPMFSGITTFVDNSGFTFGVGGGTSIFTPATNVLTFGTNNTEKVRIDANGNTNISGVTTAANFKTGVSNLHDVGLTLSGGQIDVGSNIKIGTAGVVTATTFSGSGANLTNLPAANLTGTLPAISGANLTNLPVPTTITVADESSDTTCNPLFVTTTSGNLAPKTGTNLTFNSSSGNLRTGSLFLGTGSNESKTQDGLILERNSGDGEVHITAGRSGGNYSGLQFYVAGGSGVTKRFQIDYQSNFRWYDADGTTQRVRLDNVGRFQINQNSNITGTAKLEVMGTGDTTYPQYSYAIGVADSNAYNSANGAGMGIGFSYKHNSAGSYALGCGIRGFKENTTDGNYAGALAFYTRPHGAGADEMLRITSTGQLLLGETSAFDSNVAIQFRKDNAGNQSRFIFRNRGNNGSSRVRLILSTLNRAANADKFSGMEMYQSGGLTIFNGESDNAHSGINLFSGSWASLRLRNGNVSGNDVAHIAGYWGTSNGLMIEQGGPQSGTFKAIRFTTSHYGGERGYIGVTLGGTSYNSSSDYRMKQDVVDLTGAIDRVKSFKPRRFKWKEDPTYTVDGFLAHEASTVVPESVVGEKDAVDSNGDPEYQVMDNSKLVPVLTAALKEAITKIEEASAKIETLEQDNIALRARVTNLEGN